MGPSPDFWVLDFYLCHLLQLQMARESSSPWFSIVRGRCLNMVRNSRTRRTFIDQLAGHSQEIQRGGPTCSGTHSKAVLSTGLHPFLAPCSFQPHPLWAACARSEMNYPSPAGRERQFLSLGTSWCHCSVGHDNYSPGLGARPSRGPGSGGRSQGLAFVQHLTKHLYT